MPLIRPGGLVLDLAAGNGRHSRILIERGFAVRAVDRDTSALLTLAGPRCEVSQVDLETGAPWLLGDWLRRDRGDQLPVTGRCCRRSRTRWHPAGS